MSARGVWRGYSAHIAFILQNDELKYTAECEIKCLADM